MSATIVFLFLLPLISAAHNRRILHQPFYPTDSLPPTQPPTTAPAPPTPKYPFSTPTPNNTNSNAPFFPLYPAPPPPPPPPPPTPTPSTFASFPANISSLTLPHSSSKSKPSSKLVIVAVAAVFAAVVVVSIAVFLHLRRRRRRSNANSPPTKSTPRSSYANSATIHARPPSNHYRTSHVPKLQRPSQASSEFLYLGTLVNSHAPLISNTTTQNDSSGNNMGSPELRPLPPLSGPQNNVIYRNADVVVQSSRDDDEDEEFYSPRGSIATGSASRRDFNAVEVENVNGSSSTYSSSASASPGRSVSLSLSPEHTSSSRNSIPKSQDLIEIRAIAPLYREGDSQYADSFNKDSASSLVSPSPPSSSERYSTRMSQEFSSPGIPDFWDHEADDSHSNLNSPAQISCPVVEKNLPQSSVERYPMIINHESSSGRISNASDHHQKVVDTHSNVDSPIQITSPQPHYTVYVLPPSPPLAVPPPPPPPPPRKICDSPKTPTPPAKKPAVEPPSPKSLRPIAMGGSTLISPIKLPSHDSDVVNNHAANSGFPMEEMSRSTEESAEHNDEDSSNDPKTKLKPLHWDKVRANPEKEMVWDQLKCSSFKLNEEMIETLFAVNNPNSKTNPKETMRWQVLPSPSGDNGNKVLDPKKAQNIAILLKALNVTVEEVCDGLLEGNTDTLSTELLEILLKMAPSKEEERKLKEHKDDSPVKLGAAERFLKAVLDVPHAFKRLEAMLYISNFESEVEYLRKSFATLEAACEDLRTSRMFLKLLEAVLKTGNRMNTGTNRGDAQAFKLDTLLKLVDVKGADGKTTLLHFVVQEIIRTEGARISENNNSTTPNDESKCRKLGLQVVSGLSSELSNVKKGASMDAEVLSSDVLKLSNGLTKILDIIKLTEEEERKGPFAESESSRFSEAIVRFLKRAEEEMIKIQAQESVASSLVKEITEYFHGNSAKEEAHPFRIFMVVRDFLAILDRVCREVGTTNERTMVSSAHKFPVPVNPLMQQPSGEFCSRQYNSFNDEER